MVIPPFAVVSGYPAKIIDEQPESSSTTTYTIAIQRYKSMKPVKKTVNN